MEHSQALDLASWSSEELRGSGTWLFAGCLELQLFAVKVVWTRPLQSKFRRELWRTLHHEGMQ